MKKVSKALSAVMLSATLSLAAAPAALAATVTFEGPYADGAISIGEGTEYHEADLFENLKDVMPGDSLSQGVTVENAHSEKVRVYLEAVPHDEVSNPLQYSEAYEGVDGKDGGADPERGDLLGGPGVRDEDAATMSDFLAQLDMRVYNGDALLFSGSPDIEDGLAESVFLGELAPGATLSLMVELDVPITLGNEYAYRVGEVDWVFTAEVDDPKLPDTGEDPKLPQTGDASPMLLIAGIACAAAAIALFALLALRRREKR